MRYEFVGAEVEEEEGADEGGDGEDDVGGHGGGVSGVELRNGVVYGFGVFTVIFYLDTVYNSFFVLSI